MKGSIAALLAVLTFAVAVVGTAGAAGTAYKPSQCEWTGTALICERTFQTTEYLEGQIYVLDATCASGQHVFSFTETDLVTWRQFDYYSGRAPLAKWNVGGNEVIIDTEVLAYEITADLGCA
jgi:hypothetical protein